MFRAKRHTQTLTLISILCAKWMKKKEKTKAFICDSRNAKSENNVQRAAVGQEKKKSGQQRPTKVFYLSSHNFMLWFSIFEWISSADQTKKSCIVECLHKNSLLNSSNSVPCLFYSHVSHVCFGDWRSAEPCSQTVSDWHRCDSQHVLFINSNVFQMIARALVCRSFVRRRVAAPAYAFVRGLSQIKCSPIATINPREIETFCYVVFLSLASLVRLWRKCIFVWLWWPQRMTKRYWMGCWVLLKSYFFANIFRALSFCSYEAKVCSKFNESGYFVRKSV